MSDYIKFPLILSITVMLCVSIIATLNFFTAPILEARNIETINTQLSEMYPDLVSYEISDIKPEDKTVTNTYIVTDSNDQLHYVFNTTSQGKVSNVDMLVGINEEGVIDALSYTNFNETKGIGSKLSEQSYLDTIIGQDVNSLEVDGVSGATITSTAVQKNVNAAAKEYNTNYKGGNN